MDMPASLRPGRAAPRLRHYSPPKLLSSPHRAARRPRAYNPAAAAVRAWEAASAAMASRAMAGKSGRASAADMPGRNRGS